MTEKATDIAKRLNAVIAEANLHHIQAPSRYDAGHVFELDITGVCPATKARAILDVERFVGGGFAGQVYRARLRSLDLDGPPIPGLDTGGVYAVKLLIPPSRFSVLFRNTVYWLAYQGPFAAQVNPDAARAGVLWQKLIRRGAALRFQDRQCVADTYATFLDAALGSYGEINEWVDGRNWRFEIDDQLFQRGKYAPEEAPASQEYLAKKRFMASFVRLLHEMGAPELARQYEWWTTKSQPNVLKRLDAGEGPAEGLTALDFRAGLALLPFLPMSPADVILIIRGLGRGDLVQFDRGDMAKLETYIEARRAYFDDLLPALDELKERDARYRASLPDITHHGLRLLYDRGLARSVKEGRVQGWKVRHCVDEVHARGLNASSWRYWLFLLIGAVPILGRFVRRYWGVKAYRVHVHAFLTHFGYMQRTFRAHQAQRLIEWRRSGKAGDKRILFLLNHPVVFWLLRIFPGILPLPPKWFRFLTEGRYAWEAVKETVLYPIRFYRDADFRVAWLTNEVESGAREGMLTPAERMRILGRIPDPFIQKYLKCVAVHVCTLPITQVISVIVAVWGLLYLGKTWEESVAWAVGILAAFQVLPVSPGSLTRGSYVVYLMVKERNIRNYWLAALVSFWHYVGYLGFPLQMVKEFPSLSRFMAGRWATKMVGMVPVFGERGALIEHWVFDLFFNLPLTLKRKLLKAALLARKRPAADREAPSLEDEQLGSVPVEDSGGKPAEPHPTEASSEEI
jgi:hypothetical protein